MWPRGGTGDLGPTDLTLQLSELENYPAVDLNSEGKRGQPSSHPCPETFYLALVVSRNQVISNKNLDSRFLLKIAWGVWLAQLVEPVLSISGL